jgi:hypothetical protein
MGTPDRRAELDDLRAAGVLNDAEYADAVARLEQGQSPAEAVADATGTSVDDAQQTINDARGTAQQTQPGQPGVNQGFSPPTQPVTTAEQTVQQGQPGVNQGFSPPVQTVTPAAQTTEVATTPADLPPVLSRAEQASSDAEAAGYNAEPSEMYDPVAAHAGDGYPPAPATEEVS